MPIPADVIRDASRLNVSVQCECHQPVGKYRGVAIEKIGKTRYAETEAIYDSEDDALHAVIKLVETKGRPLTQAEMISKFGEQANELDALKAKLAAFENAKPAAETPPESAPAVDYPQPRSRRKSTALTTPE